MSKVLYPGSFDPITKGHESVIMQAANLFDELIIAVMNNPSKSNTMFTPEERAKIIKHIYKDVTNISVVISDQAAIDVAIQNNCNALIRGLRSISDFEHEVGLAHLNRNLSYNQIRTICLFADIEHQYTSSSVVKEIFRLNKPLDNYIHPYTMKQMIRKRALNE